jgi:transposase, IS30 family
VAALERLAVREISSRFLSQDERIEIADLRHAGHSVRQIACRLGRSPSRVSRELRRKVTASGSYRPFEAQRKATARRARNHLRESRPMSTCGPRSAGSWRSGGVLSKVSRHLRRRFPDENELNNRPRVVLNDRTPAELFNALLT